MLIGAHQSIAGGVHKAWSPADEDGCEAVQIFTKNASMWKEPVIAPDQARAFADARAKAKAGSAPVLSHDSYLINLCGLEPDLRIKSREALLQEALRCEALGVDYVVLHPGAHMGAGAEAGVAHAAEALAWVLERTRGAKVGLLVENTAGQGSCIAANLSEVGAILRGIDQLAGGDAKARAGVCLDTCHTFAAGYDLSTPEGFDATWALIEREFGVDRIRAMHLNDSKKGLGCRVDRHERFGEGELGKYPFWRLMNDPRLARVVGVLETPPVEKDRAFRDQLLTLRGLVGAEAPAVKAATPAEEKPAPKPRAKRKAKSAADE
jgi:deoxyribonuclease-4